MRRFFLYILTIFLVLPQAGWSQFLSSTDFSRDPIRVALFPFEVISEKDLSYLQLEIPKIIEARFATADIATELIETAPDQDEETLRNISLGEKCTHAIRGRLVWEGPVAWPVLRVKSCRQPKGRK